MREFLNIAPEVANALSDCRAVVALESTVIAHGLPRPQNLQTAQRLEQIVREAGATPATIATSAPLSVAWTAVRPSIYV